MKELTPDLTKNHKFPNKHGKYYFVKHKEGKFSDVIYRGLTIYSPEDVDPVFMYYDFYSAWQNFRVFEMTNEEFVKINLTWKLSK
jgi:hypothetical protein